ncbi:MAG: hypothetical protein ACYTGJ_13660 [Planctomycetota bacterium]|jgi:hypothetical protein
MSPLRRALLLTPLLLVAAISGSSPCPASQDATGVADPPEEAAGEPAGIARETTRGPVTAVISLAPATPRIGDVITLSLEVTAAADVEVLMPAFGESLGSFSILEFAPREELSADGSILHSQRYSLDVPNSGEWRIPPLIVEFVDGREGKRPAPEGEDAYELLTEALPFTVASVIPTDAAAELRPPLGPLDPLPTALERATPWIGLALLLLVALPLGIVLIVRARRRVRRRSAYDLAVSRLRALARAPRGTPEEIDRFFVELSAIVRRYLEDRFEIRAPESTTEEFLDRASRSASLSDEHGDLLDRFLRRADLVKFARTIPGETEIEDSLASAERFLEETRHDAPLLEVAEGRGA